MKDDDLYIEEWAKMLITMWHERIEMLGVIDTGYLHQSLNEAIAERGGGKTITLKFKEYGIYQSLGVGNGYSHNNGGDLKILDPTYREEHGLNKRRKDKRRSGGKTSGKPRKRRDWFSKKYYLSVMNLKEDLARIVGEQAALTIADALNDMHDAVKVNHK